MSTVGRRPTTVTGWVGWIWFAALILIINGGFNVIDGLVALFKHQAYVSTPNHLVVFNFTAWGWIMLIIGILEVLIGLFLMRGSLWARISAIIIVTINCIAQVGFITVYPFWSLLVIAMSVIVLWALLVHGEEAAAANE
jgi:hypothetical protein